MRPCHAHAGLRAARLARFIRRIPSHSASPSTERPKEVRFGASMKCSRKFVTDRSNWLLTLTAAEGRKERRYLTRGTA
jgi:hypothetical protein